MNDFGIDLKGLHGVLKQNRGKHLKTTEERTFILESGPGCNPASGTRRTVKGKWLTDGMREEMSSYDFEYVIDPKTKERTNTLLEAQDDTVPVKLASEQQASKTVKRKRGA